MSYTYDQRKRPQGQKEPAAERTAAPGPDFSALMNGTARPTAAQKGRSFDLDAAMKARMEHAFGDLSNLKLYESPAVGQAGAEAIAQGNEIAFAPGIANFSTREGQERLGHELSHVMSQRSGAVRGGGFLNSPALEARADREGAMAAAGEQVYSGPVTNALSSAGPAPAAAGPMQAKRNWFGGGKKKKSAPIVQPSDDIESPQLPNMDYSSALNPRSKYAADFDILNSQGGSDEERKQAYNTLSFNAVNNVTEEERSAISDYISSSSMTNSYLRGQKDNLMYPQGEQIQQTAEQAEKISQGLRKNPLQENMTVYRGTTDKFFAYLVDQAGMKNGLNSDGSINHEWMNQNQKTLRKKLIGSVFRDKAFTSTSTEKKFAQDWSRLQSRNEKMFDLGMKGKIKEARKFERMAKKHPERIPGAHLLTVNVPKGANATFVDRMTDKEKGGGVNQRELLLDKDSAFKISDIRKMEDSDSYELVMDLLAEEAGKKKKKK